MDVTAPPDISGAASGAASGLAQAAPAIPSVAWSGYLMTLALLFLLLAALWFALRFLKKRGNLRFFGTNADLQIESRLSLGPKKNLLIVRTPHKRLLLGVTDHHISKISELPLDGTDDLPPPQSPPSKRRAKPFRVLDETDETGEYKEQKADE
jgi:flagellar biosynthetic protein FliO